MKRIFLFAGLLLSVVASASAVDYKNDYVSRFYDTPVWELATGLSVADQCYQPVVYADANGRAHVWLQDCGGKYRKSSITEYVENASGTALVKGNTYYTEASLGSDEPKGNCFCKDDANHLLIGGTTPFRYQYSTEDNYVRGYFYMKYIYVYDTNGNRLKKIDIKETITEGTMDIMNTYYNTASAAKKAEMDEKMKTLNGAIRYWSAVGDIMSAEGGVIIASTSVSYPTVEGGANALRDFNKILVIPIKNGAYDHANNPCYIVECPKYFLNMVNLTGGKYVSSPISEYNAAASYGKDNTSWDNAIFYPFTDDSGVRRFGGQFRSRGFLTFTIDKLLAGKKTAAELYDYKTFYLPELLSENQNVKVTTNQYDLQFTASVIGGGCPLVLGGHNIVFNNIYSKADTAPYSERFTGIDCGTTGDEYLRRYVYTNPGNDNSPSDGSSTLVNFLVPYKVSDTEMRVIQFAPARRTLRCFQVKLLPKTDVFKESSGLNIPTPVNNSNVVTDDVVYQGEKIDKKPSDAVYLVGAVTRGDSNSKLFPMYDVRGTGDYQGTFNIPSNLKFFYFVDKAGNRIAPATNVTRELSDGTKEERQEPVVIGGTGVFNVTNFNDGPVTFVYRKDTKMASFWPAAKKDCIYLVGKASGNLQPTSENSDQLKPYRLYDFTNDGVYEGTIQIGAGNFEFYLQHGLNGEAGSYTIGATDATAMTLVNDGASKGAIRTGKTPFAVSSWTEEKAVRFILDTRSAEWKLYAESGIGGAISVFGDMYVVINGVPQKMTERIASRVYDCSLPAGNNTFYFKKNIGSTNGVTFNMGAPAPNTALTFDANKEASVGGVTAGTNTYRINESAPVMLTFDMVQGTLTAVSGDKRPEIVDLTLTANWAKPSSSLSGSDGYPRGGDVFARVFAYRPVLKDPAQSATSNVRLMAAGAGKIIAVADTIKNKNANNSVAFGGDKSLVRAKSYNVDVDTYYSWYDQITFKVPSTTTGNTDYPADPVRNLTVDFFPDESGTGRWVAVINFDQPDTTLPISEYIVKDPNGNVIAVISGDALLTGQGGDKTQGGPGTPWNAYQNDTSNNYFVTSEQFTYPGDNPGDRGDYTVEVVYAQTNDNIIQEKPATSTNEVKPTGVNKVITDEMGEAIVSLRAVAVSGAVVSDVKGADLDFNAFKNALAPGSYLIQVNGKKVIKVLVK